MSDTNGEYTKVEYTKGKQIVDAPRAHYTGLYEKSDALEISARTGLTWDAEGACFSMTLMGTALKIGHPVFRADGLRGPYEEILVMRYLLEGRYVPASGAMLAYSEMPWGSVYNSQFNGRVIGRIARMFGGDPSLLKTAIEGTPGLDFRVESGADAAYRFEFLNGFFMSVLVWAGDDEFPASAQALFSDNFKHAFTAEDMAVAFDIAVSRLKQTLNTMREGAV